MQVSCVNPPLFDLPPSDIQRMRSQLAVIDQLMKDVEDGQTTADTYQGLKEAVLFIDEIILSLDNSNDFFKLGGFNRIIPLLNCPNAEIVALTAELIADLCQNNKFCQSKALEIGLVSELVQQLEKPLNSNVRLKSLYALSCLCRHNEEAIKFLSETNAVQVLLNIMQKKHEKLRAKTAFFITHLSGHEVFREAFYSADLVPILIKLLQAGQDSSTEHLLGALVAQVSKHVQSRVQCVSKEYNLYEILRAKADMYDSDEEFEECVQHCGKLHSLCFHDVKKDVHNK